MIPSVTFRLLFRCGILLLIVVLTCHFSVIDSSKILDDATPTTYNVEQSEEANWTDDKSIRQTNTTTDNDLIDRTDNVNERTDVSDDGDIMTILHSNYDEMIHHDNMDLEHSISTRMMQSNQTNAPICKLLFDRNIFFGQIDCGCTKKSNELQYEVQCLPVNPRCGPFGTTCGEVSITGILDVFGWGPFLTLKFCFNVVKILTVDTTIPICTKIGPNILQLLLISIGVPLPVIRVIALIIQWLDGVTPGTKEVLSLPNTNYNTSSSLTSYQNGHNRTNGTLLRRKKHHRNWNQNACEVTIGNTTCQLCQLCNDGKGIQFNCSNVNVSYVSMGYCTPIFGNNSLNAGIPPPFDF